MRTIVLPYPRTASLYVQLFALVFCLLCAPLPLAWAALATNSTGATSATNSTGATNSTSATKPAAEVHNAAPAANATSPAPASNATEAVSAAIKDVQESPLSIWRTNATIPEVQLTPEQQAQLEAERKAKEEAELKAKAEAEEKARLEAEENAKQEARERAKQLRQEAENARLQSEKNAENALWDEAFKQRQAELNAVEIDVDSLSQSVTSLIWPLRQALPSLQEAARKLFSLATSHKNNPMMLEVIDRRGVMLASDLRRQLQPLYTARNLMDTQTMALSQLRAALPEEQAAATAAGPSLSTQDKGRTQLISPEQMEARERVVSMERKLARVKRLLDDALAPAEALLTPLGTMRTRIAEYLPSLWQSYYLEMPSRFFDPAVWQSSEERWRKTVSNMQLRLSIEVPHTMQDWKGLGLRALNVFVLGSLLILFTRSRLKKSKSPEIQRESSRILRGLFRMLLGLALMVGSVGNNGEMFRACVIVGSLLIIGGEMALAWALRCVALEHKGGTTPLWPLFVSTTWGTALSYPDLPEGILSLSWILASVLMFSILQGKRKKSAEIPQLEGGLVLVHRLTLLLSLGMAIFGWARMSILLLITINCLVVSTQLVWGLLQIINRSAEGNKDDSQTSMLAGIVAACTAPAVLVLVVISTTLWVIALPGGANLLWFYLKSGVQIGKASFNMMSLLLIVSGFYLTRAAITTARTFLARVAVRSQRLDTSLIPPMQTGITYGFWSLFGLFTLQAIGFGLDNLAVIAGGLSVGIGFGLQTIVNNFLSGLILIFSRTLHEGDVVDVGGLLGTVRKISVRATTVETFDNALIFVPNSEFVSNRLINWTRNGRAVRRNLMVGVAYGTDPALVERLLLQVAREDAQVQTFPAPQVVFTDFAASTLNFTLRYWSDISNDPFVGSRMRFEIMRLFAENGVQIAFPQLDIHLVSSTPGAASTLASVAAQPVEALTTPGGLTAPVAQPAPDAPEASAKS